MFKCVLSLLVLLTFTIYMVNADVFSLLETNSDLSVDSRILLSTHALKPGHPVITKCVTHRVYPLQLRVHQSFVGSSELQFALYKAFGQVSMLGGESHEQSSPCHYRLKVQFNNVTSYNQAEMIDKPASLQTLMPHWDLVHTVTAKIPITFDQSIDGSITNIQIPSVANMDVSAEMAEGYEDAIHALLFQLEFKSNSIGKPHSARSGVAHAYRGHEYAPGDDYRVTTVYSGEERVYEAAQPSQTPETITIFRVVRDFVPDQRKPASESVIYVNRRVITENFVRPGVAGVAHSQQRQIVTNIQDATVHSEFDQQDPDLQASGGANFKFAIESVAILGDALDYLPELQRFIKAEQIFPVYGPETRRDRNSAAPAADATAQNFKNQTNADDVVSEVSNMRFRSLRSRSSASIQPHSAVHQQRFRQQASPKEYTIQKEFRFGGEKDIIGYFSPGIKVLNNPEDSEVSVGFIVEAGIFSWGQQTPIVKFIPSVVQNTKTQKRKFHMELENPSFSDATTNPNAWAQKILKFFGFEGDRVSVDPGPPATCDGGLTNDWLKRDVSKYKATAQFSYKNDGFCIGGVLFRASVWGLAASVKLTFNLKPSITVGADLCKSKDSTFVSAGFQINFGAEVNVAIDATVGLPGAEPLYAPDCEPSVAFPKVGISGTITLISLKWPVAYSAPVSSPLSGCVNTFPSATVLGGDIKVVAEAMPTELGKEFFGITSDLKFTKTLWKSDGAALCQGFFESWYRVWCNDENLHKTITNEKTKSSITYLLSEDYRKKWGIFFTCNNEELVSRQAGASPIWLKHYDIPSKKEKWQWTPMSRDFSETDRQWAWCDDLVVKPDCVVAKWRNKLPAPANQKLIKDLCENPTGLLPDRDTKGGTWDEQTMFGLDKSVTYGTMKKGQAPIYQ